MVPTPDSNTPDADTSTGTGTGTDDEATTPVQTRGLMQWAGVLTVIVALALGIAPLVGLSPTNDSTIRLYLSAGILLIAGREVVRGVIESLLG